MAIEKHFVKEGIREAEIEEFLKEKFDKAGYSHIEIQRTPLGTRIIVYADRPGLVIGKYGSRVKEITDEVQKRFELENPMLDVKEIENPLLDAQVVASKITKALERGAFYKKVANWYVSEVMKAGAAGIEIRVAGKLGGERSRFQKFRKGYIKHSGHYADTVVDKGKAFAITKPGVVGVQVKILRELPEITRIKEVEKVEDKGNEKA
ncbi:MAG: 30S ribosomal protein S3 [Candidatus Aenigmarchaeota archaeon]|nr:30S ribosomal protein S3 [Candidatus Aenigmarchaeota archaeon]